MPADNVIGYAFLAPQAKDSRDDETLLTASQDRIQITDSTYCLCEAARYGRYAFIAILPGPLISYSTPRQEMFRRKLAVTSAYG